MNKIADIHSHIIYDIDDGSNSLDTTLKLIEMEYKQGVRDIFCTSHSYYMENNFKLYNERFSEINKIVNNKYSDLSLYKGCEILLHKHKILSIIKNIDNNVFPTLNNTKYVLVEFDPDNTDGIQEMIYCLRKILEHKYIPIIAHAERYGKLYENIIEDISYLREIGCLVQINLYSVSQDKGERKDIANLLLTHKLVDFVGTDAHRLNYKSPEVTIGVEELYKIYDADYVDNIVYNNADILRTKTENDKKAYSKDILSYSWISIKDWFPRSAKTIPCWIKNQEDVDLVFLSEDEQYFISISKKKKYPVDQVQYWVACAHPTL